jgi:hypothetical protein
MDLGERIFEAFVFPLNPRPIHFVHMALVATSFYFYIMSTRISDNNRMTYIRYSILFALLGLLVGIISII